MAATTSSIAIHIPKYNNFIISSSSSKPASLHVSQPSKACNKPEKSLSLAQSLAVASAAVISPLTSSPYALAAKQIAESPQEDNRGLLLLVPVAAAVGWVLFNILGPALNQLNRMRSEKVTVFGLGLGGLLTAASSSAVFVESASAASEAVESEGGGGGSSQGLLALIVAAAVGLEVVMLNSMQSKYEEKGSSE